MNEMSIKIRSICFLMALVTLVAFGCKKDSEQTSGHGDAETSMPVIAAGTEPPEFELKDLNGNPVALSAFRGKTVLLNFWATWCAPCVAEMPALERLYQLLKANGLEVVAVSTDPDSKLEELKKFKDRYGISFTILRDPLFGVPSRYGVTGFPETFFVGKDGKVLTFRDPVSGEAAPKVVSDRPWDAPEFIEAVRRLVAP